jgi:hypothetical protein
MRRATVITVGAPVAARQHFPLVSPTCRERRTQKRNYCQRPGSGRTGVFFYLAEKRSIAGLRVTVRSR